MKWKFWKSEEEHSPDTAENREYIAEALEGRILYSGAPMDAEMPAAETEVVADAENSQHTFESLESFGANSGSIAPPEQQDGQSGTAQSELVTLTSLDNLTADEIEELARISADYWKNADLDENRQDALQALESAVLDIVSLAEPSAFILEVDASESGIFVDFPESTTILPGQSDQLGVELITDLLREVGEPEVLERLAAEQIAARTVEVPVEQQPLTLSTLDFIAEAAEQAWINSGLTADQVAALDRIEYQIVELEGAHLGYAEGSSIYIDDDAAERSWYLDETPYDLSETGFEGIDLLSVLIHEQGHVLGLEDIYQSTSNSVMYGFFGEGERRIAGDGEADGAVAGSLEGAHYAHTGLNQVTIADQAAWDAAVGAMSTNDEIVFNGAGGPINISGTVSVGAIHFQSGVYTLNGGTLNIEDSIHADANATIGSTVNIGTGGLTVTGPADVVIDGVVQDFDYQSAVQADNPISYWTFDEASTGTAAANDTGSGGSSDDGAFTGTATRTAGLRGTGAAQFNDTANDGVNVGNGADFSAATFTGGITIETLFTTDFDGSTGHEEFFRKEDGNNRILLSFQTAGSISTGSAPGIAFGINAGGYSELDISLDGAGGRPTLASIADGYEHHLAATYDPVTGNREVYLDEVLIGSDNRGAGTPLSTTGSGGANAIIGNLASGSEPFGGTIDEMAIYNRALSQAEIQTHIGGAAGDLTKTGNGTLTLNGANTFTGEATVSGGNVVVGNADALGATSGETTVEAGATLQLDGGVTFAAETVTLTDTATLLSQSGNNTMTGNLVLAGPGTPEIQVAAGQLEVDGNVSGTGFQKTGAGDLVIDGAVAVRTIDAQSGGTDINGTTDIGAGLTVTGPANVTIDGVVQDGGTGNFAPQATADGAVALWSLNETSGTTAVNSGTAGATLNGAHVNDPTLGAADVNGDGDGATDFDAQQNASGDHIEVSGFDSVAGGNPFENDWTIEAWFVRDTQQRWSAIASNNYDNAAADNGRQGPIMTMRNNTHELGFMAAGVTEDGVYVDLGAASLGQPVYAVITKTGGNTQGNATITVHANVNGTWLTSATGTNARAIRANDGFYIGNHWTSGNHLHDGVIDEVAVYDRALSLDEIQAHYAGIGGLTKSGDGTLTLNGTNTFTGETTVSGGTAVLGNADALGATSGETEVQSGATLAVSGGVTVAAETITLEGAATVENVSGNNTLTGVVNTVADGSGSAILLATAGTLELDGAVSLANTLTVDGAGDVTIDGVVQDNGGSTPYQTAVRADEPISYWTFDEANSGTGAASDTGSGGSSDDGTFEGTATRTDGLGGTTGAALFTDTAGERVNAGNGSDFSSAAFAGGMTIETLFTADYDGSDFEYFIRKEDGNNRILLGFQRAANMEGHGGGTVVGTGTNPGITFGINVDGTYSELDIKFDGQDGRPTLAQMTDGNEHHLAATYDPVTGARSVFLDGVLIGSDNRGAGNAITTTAPGGQIAAIGNTNGSGPDAFGGVLDEFAIYGKALTAAQIQAHINAERNLVMDGDGTLTLTAANTYSGETTVNTGTLAATNADALGSTGVGTTVNTGGTLLVDGGVTLAAETVTLNDTATLLSQSGNNTMSGNLVLNSPGSPEIQVAAGQLEVDGSVSGTGFQKTGAGNLVIDGAVTVSTIDAQAGGTDINGTVDVGAGLTVTGPADVVIDGVVQNGAGVYAQVVANDSAVAHWRLNETSGDAIDVIGGQNGTYTNFAGGNLGVASGQGDGGANFDGSNDHVVGLQGTLNDTHFDGDWTIEAWFTRDDADTNWNGIFSTNQNVTNAPLMTFFNSGNGNNRHWLGMNPTGSSATPDIYVDLDQFGGGGGAYLGEQIYATMTLSGTTLSMNVNVGGTWLSPVTQTLGRALTTSSTGYTIGRHWHGGNYHDGVIDEVAIYDRALSTAEIQAHYAGTGGLTKSGNGTLTLNGANTFIGEATVSGGTVVAGSADALGTTSGETTVGTGATLALTGGVTLAAETITLDDTGKLENVSGTNTVTGTLVSTGGNASVVQSTAGTLNLDGPVTMVGALTFDGAGDTVVDGIISDNGAVGLPAAILSGQGAGGNLDLLESGGSLIAGNIASQSAGAVAFAHDVINHATHAIDEVNDGIYGNDSSWIGLTDNSFVGVKFAEANSIDAIAWGRSNTNSHNDRDLGTYTIQYTTDAALDTANPGAVTWQTIDSVTYTGSYPDGTPHLRHLWGFDAVHNVTGVRIVTDSISDAFPLAIDELEVHPAVFPELTKTGNGTLTLNGANTYTGDTTVSGGTLDGTGTVGGNLTVDASGTVDPGESGIGTLTVNGDATINGNLATEIGSGAANTDLLSVGGTLDVANAALQGSGTGDQTEYVIASYTGTDPTAFSAVTAPTGYEVEFDAANDQIKLVQTADPGCTSGHGTAHELFLLDFESAAGSTIFTSGGGSPSSIDTTVATLGATNNADANATNNVWGMNTEFSTARADFSTINGGAAVTALNALPPGEYQLMLEYDQSITNDNTKVGYFLRGTNGHAAEPDTTRGGTDRWLVHNAGHSGPGNQVVDVDGDGAFSHITIAHEINGSSANSRTPSILKIVAAGDPLTGAHVFQQGSFTEIGLDIWNTASGGAPAAEAYYDNIKLSAIEIPASVTTDPLVNLTFDSGSSTTVVDATTRNGSFESGVGGWAPTQGLNIASGTSDPPGSTDGSRHAVVSITDEADGRGRVDLRARNALSEANGDVFTINFDVQAPETGGFDRVIVQPLTLNGNTAVEHSGTSAIFNLTADGQYHSFTHSFDFTTTGWNGLDVRFTFIKDGADRSTGTYTATLDNVVVTQSSASLANTGSLGGDATSTGTVSFAASSPDANSAGLAAQFDDTTGEVITYSIPANTITAESDWTISTSVFIDGDQTTFDRIVEGFFDFSDSAADGTAAVRVSTPAQTLTTTPPLSPGWHNLTLTFDYDGSPTEGRGQTRFYLDGELFHNNSNALRPDFSTGLDLNIGGDARPMNGLVDDVQFFCHIVLPEAVDEGIAPDFKQTTVYVNDDWTRQADIATHPSAPDGDIETTAVETATWGSNAFGNLADALAALDTTQPVTIVINAGDYSAETLDLSALSNNVTVKIVADGTETDTDTAFIGSITAGANVSFQLDADDDHTIATNLTVGDANASSIAGVISGNGSLTKVGSGALTLTGQNTFTGETVLDGGTLNLSATGGNTLAATSTLSVGDSTTGTANDTTLNINSNQTLASLNYHLESATHNGNTTHDTILASGVTVTTGGFVNGLVANVTGDEVLTTTGGTVSGTVNIKGASAGDGALIVNGGSTDLSIGISDPPYQGNAGTRNYTLDMTGLGSFAATTTGNVYAFAGWRDDVDWKMADTSNTITAATFSHTSWGAHSQIELGGDTTLNITDINIGSEVVPGHQGSSNGGQQTISFRGDLTGTPELTIRDTAGTGRADLHIGLGGDTNGLITSTVDLTGGTIDALLNELVIGEGHTRTDTNGNDGSGTLTFEAGHIDAISTVLGRTTTTNGEKNGYGTINHNGGTLCTVTLTLTDQLGDATTATYNLAGGVLEATTIEQGQSGSGTITFDWTGGTIANKTGTDLTISSDVTLTTTGAGGQSFDADSGQTITLNGQLTGTGGFATSDAGTVNITNATNDSTGQTDVNAGVLAGIGTVNNLYINAGGTVDPGAPGVVGTLSVVNGVTQNGGDLHIDVDGGTSDLLDVTGTITLNDDVIFDVINAPTAITIPIMENDGTGDPVSSVFTGLPEGAGVTLGGISYVISYAGDDGNDIVLTKDAIPVVTNNDPAVTFTEAGAPVTIAPNLSVTDAENQITAASVSIDNFVAGEDMLAINGTLPAGITADLSVPGTITLTGAATPADYQAALQLITYQNTDTQSPSTAPRSITISVTDGAGLTASAAQTVNVIDTAEPTAPGTGTTDPLGELNLNGGSGIFQGFRFSLYNRDPDERQGEEFDETLPDVLLTLTPFYSGTTSPDARVTIRVIGPGGEVPAGGTQTVTAGRSGFFAASFPGLELDRNTAYVVVIEESIPDGDGNFHRGPARALFAPSINSQEITQLQDLIDFQSELNVMERELLRNLYPNGIIGLDLGIEIKP